MKKYSEPKISMNLFRTIAGRLISVKNVLTEKKLAIETGIVSDPITEDRITANLIHEISKAKPSLLTTTEKRIEFKGGLLRPVSNTNLLVPISFGLIEVGGSKGMTSITYTLRFDTVFYLATGIVFIFFGPVVFLTSKGGGPPPIFILLIFWVWLYFGNYFLTLIRFKSLIKRTIKKSIKV